MSGPDFTPVATVLAMLSAGTLTLVVLAVVLFAEGRNHDRM